MAEQFGWMLSTRFDNDLGKSNRRVGLSVALIRPYCETEASGKPEDFAEDPGPEISTMEALEKFGPLMFPWKGWIAGWRIFDAKDLVNPIGVADAPPIVSRSGVAPIDNDVKNHIREQVTKEVLEITSAEILDKTFKDAFSVLPDAAERETHRSFPHALAPMSQLVAPLSNEVLQFGHIVEAPEGIDFENGSLWVAFPVVILDETPYEPTNVRLEDQVFLAEYAVKAGDGAALVMMAEGSPVTHERHTPDAPDHSNQAVYKKRRLAIDTALYGVAPAAMVSKALQLPNREPEGSEAVVSFPSLKSKHGLFLLNSLGVGWLFDEDNGDEYVNHAFHTYLTEDELSKITKTKKLSDKLPPNAVSESDAKALLGKARIDATPLKEELAFFELVRRLVVQEDYPNQGDIAVTAWANAVAVLAQPDRLASLSRCWLRFIVWSWRGELSGEPSLVAICDDLLTKLEQYSNSHQSESSALAALHYAFDGDLANDIAGVFPLPPAKPSETDEGTSTPMPPGNVRIDGQDRSLAGWLAKIFEALGVSVSGALLSRDGQTATLITDAWIDEQVAAFKQQVEAEAKQKALARDDGLIIRVEDDSKHGDSDNGDEAMRGYAVAVRSEIGGLANTVRKQWITNVAITYKEEQEDGENLTIEQFRILTDNGKPVVSSGAIGSAIANGRRIVSTFYEGRPLCAARGRHREDDGSLYHDGWVDSKAKRDTDGKWIYEYDADGTRSFEYAWYEEITEGEGESETKPYRMLPLVYGAKYQTVITKIANSGVIDDPRFRDADSDFDATLKDAVSIEDGLWGDVDPYYCNEAIGAPDAVIESESNLELEKCYSLSNQTTALVYARQTMAVEQSVRAETIKNDGRGLYKLTTNPKVAVMVHADDRAVSKGEKTTFRPFKEKSPTFYTLRLEPPLASATMIERWLNSEEQLAMDRTDYNLVADTTIRDALNASTIDNSHVASLRDDILELYKTLAPPNPTPIEKFPIRYNPAVSAYGLRITWRGRPNSPRDPQFYVIPFNRIAKTTVDGNPKLTLQDRSDVQATITAITVGEGQRTSQTVNFPNRSIKVQVEPGEFVSIEVFSLVESKLFAGKADDSLERLSQAVGETALTFEDTTYRAFGGATYWFEAAPRAVVNTVGLEDKLLRVVTPLNANEGALLRVDTAAIEKPGAEWIEGLAVEKHQWHWVGTPTEFYVDGALSDNIVNLSGVGSFRGSRDTSLLKYLSKEDGQLKVVNEQVVDTISRSAMAPADYFAYVVRPIVRFRDWLHDDAKINDNPIAIESKRMATGVLLPGQSPLERLEAPVARWVAPLTESYDEQKNSALTYPDRGTNGNILVFDEPIMRTDERAHYGGVAEFIDVDVVNVRPYTTVWKDKNNHDVVTDYTYLEREMGPNPIFHRAPTLNTKPERERIAEFNVTASLPFGLTYDVGRNPKVTQSAITVFPVKTDGQWFMAKLRTRRMLLPEMLVDYPKAPKVAADEEYKMCLGLREAGDDQVPSDSYIDFDADCIPETVRFDALVGTSIDHSYEIELPEAVKAKAELEGRTSQDPSIYRLRITWHKDRFGTAEAPHWRPQVDFQARERRNGKWLARWKTDGTVATPYEGKNQKEWPAKVRFDNLLLVVKTKEAAGDMGPRIGKLNASDYSDAFWVSFVGMFGNESLGRSDQYRLEFNDRTAKIVCSEDIKLKTKASESTFHVLCIYRPDPPVMNTEASATAGRRIAVYTPTGVDGEFERQDSGDDTPGADCFGYIMTFQKISASTALEKGKIEAAENLKKGTLNDEDIAGWEHLQTRIFVEFEGHRGLNQDEALIRPVPEYLGPIYGK